MCFVLVCFVLLLMLQLQNHKNLFPKNKQKKMHISGASNCSHELYDCIHFYLQDLKLPCKKDEKV